MCIIDRGEAVLPQRIRKLHGGGIAEAPAGKMREPHVDEPAQERAPTIPHIYIV